MLIYGKDFLCYGIYKIFFLLVFIITNKKLIIIIPCFKNRRLKGDESKK